MREIVNPSNEGYDDMIYDLEEFIFGQINTGEIVDVNGNGYLFKYSDLPYEIPTDAAIRSKIKEDLEEALEFHILSINQILDEHYINDEDYVEEDEDLSDAEYVEQEIKVIFMKDALCVSI